METEEAGHTGFWFPHVKNGCAFGAGRGRIPRHEGHVGWPDTARHPQDVGSRIDRIFARRWTSGVPPSGYDGLHSGVPRDGPRKCPCDIRKLRRRQIHPHACGGGHLDGTHPNEGGIGPAAQSGLLSMLRPGNTYGFFGMVRIGRILQIHGGMRSAAYPYALGYRTLP